MGSYSELRVGNHEIIMMKNGIDLEISHLFSNYDYCKSWDEELEESIHSFKTKVKVMKKRLNLLGYTYEKSKFLLESRNYEALNFHNDRFETHNIRIRMDEWIEFIKWFYLEYSTSERIINMKSLAEKKIS